MDLDPATVVIEALPKAKHAIPNNPKFALLGKPGDPVWILPQIQDPDFAWLVCGQP